MDDSDKPMNIDEAARAALVALLRRLFTQLANTAQKDSAAYRAALKGLE